MEMPTNSGSELENESAEAAAALSAEKGLEPERGLENEPMKSYTAKAPSGMMLRNGVTPEHAGEIFAQTAEIFAYQKLAYQVYSKAFKEYADKHGSEFNPASYIPSVEGDLAFEVYGLARKLLDMDTDRIKKVSQLWAEPDASGSASSVSEIEYSLPESLPNPHDSPWHDVADPVMANAMREKDYFNTHDWVSEQLTGLTIKEALDKIREKFF